MRIVRVNQAAPEGSPLELHPQLTVLLGPPPAIVGRLEHVFHEMCEWAEPDQVTDHEDEHLGEIEVHGIRLAIGPQSSRVLDLDPGLEPVLRFREPGAGADEAQPGHSGGPQQITVVGDDGDPVVVELDEDPDDPVVERLVAIRSAVADAEGHSAALRRRRHELRAEEAELLDHLGFETMDHFVAHDTANRARLERAVTVTPARAVAIEPSPPHLAERFDSPPWLVLRRLAEQRSVSHVGSVPLLIEGVMAGRPDVIDELERMADVVQIVAVTDDAGVASWASRLGPDTASVVCW